MNPKSPYLLSPISYLPETPSSISHFPSSKNARASRGSAFTLVEILVVVSIIGLLAGLALPAIQGALTAAKRAEVAAAAQSVRTAVLAWNSEYGTWPASTNSGGGTTTAMPIDASLLSMLTSASNTNNPRGIIFLEVPAKFTNASGLVTPKGYLKDNAQSPFMMAVDSDGDGSISVGSGSSATNIRSAVGVWAPDNRDTNKVVGTWK